MGSNGQPLGTYTASDNRGFIQMANGQFDLLLTAYDPDAGVWVLTFNGLAYSQNGNSMIYRRAGVTSQQYPQTQQVALDGVWGTVLPNGVRAVIQIQGNQFQVDSLPDGGAPPPSSPGRDKLSRRRP